MSTQWLRIIRGMKDQTVGQALVRLAGLAAAAQRYETARGVASDVALAGKLPVAPRVAADESFARKVAGRSGSAARREVSR